MEGLYECRIELQHNGTIQHGQGKGIVSDKN